MTVEGGTAVYYKSSQNQNVNLNQRELVIKSKELKGHDKTGLMEGEGGIDVEGNGGHGHDQDKEKEKRQRVLFKNGIESQNEAHTPSGTQNVTDSENENEIENEMTINCPSWESLNVKVPVAVQRHPSSTGEIYDLLPVRAFNFVLSIIAFYSTVPDLT